MMRKAWLGATCLVASAAIVIGTACREPTAIILEITTDVPCADVLSGGGVDVRVGAAATVETSPSSQFQTLQCTGGKVGSLTIVPSGDEQDQVGLFVAVASKANPSIDQGKSVDCSSVDPGNCIVAKRVLRYIPHTQLALPIHLGQACAGSNCAEGFSCDPSDGQCKPDDQCIKNPASCTSSGDAGPGVIDAGPPCVLCGGTSCVDFTTDSQNCGACGSRCGGVCVGGACKLAASAVATTSEGCIAVDGAAVMWTSTGNFQGALSYAPNAGASSGTVLVGTSNFGNVAGSGGGLGFSTLTFPLPGGTSLAQDYSSTPPPPKASGLLWTLTVGAHLGVAKSKAGVRCATYVDAIGNSVVGCPPSFAATSPFPAKPGPIAVGKDYWLAIIGPDTPTSQIAIGDFTGKVLVQSTVANARAVSVIPGSNDFFVAHATSITRFGWAAPQSQLATIPYYVGTTTIRGVRADGGAVFFAETPDAQQGRIRKAVFPPVNPPMSASTGVASGTLTRLGPLVCLDADNTGVYFLSNGIPYRRPR